MIVIAKLIRYFFSFITICSVLLLASCSDDDLANSQDSSYDSVLVSSERFSTRSVAELKSLITLANINVDIDRLKYNVGQYKVTYKTTYKGNEIEASALVILPLSEDILSLPVLSFQHGTIFSQAEAPTNVPASDPYLILYAAAATTGVIMVVPDYIGYGVSDNIVHPYFIAEPTTRAVLDNIKAGRELAELNGLKFNGELFLAGYSQGGFATMATHKAIEDQGGFEDYELVTSYPAAGSYIGTNQVLIEPDNVFPPHFTTLRIFSYLAHYDLSLTINDFIQAPYAALIPDLFDGTLTSTEILPSLNNNAGEYFTNEFLSGDNKFAPYLEAQASNDVSDWIPKARMVMYHSTQDNTAPVSGSLLTYERFEMSGATNVTLVTSEDGDHLEAVIPYVELLFNDLIDQL